MTMHVSEYPIDIVIPWVDSSDPVWEKEHDKYTADVNSDNSDARFRGWDLFRYWFRSIELYAPWVRTIHFVTFGHLPEWLDTGNKKLHIVNHRDFIPGKYLPTFSSHTIELNMHRIPGLSEHFVYFNDDVYMTCPMQETEFFQNGRPVDTAVFGIIKNNDINNFMPYIMLNMMALINMRFSKREMLRRDLFKWMTLRNGKGFFNNLYLLPWDDYTGFRNYHTCVSFCKKTFEIVWAENKDILDRTCSHKFRSREDVNQYLMRYWQLCEGNFVPHKPVSRYITIKGNDTSDKVKLLLKESRYKILCVNDDPMDFDFETEQKKLKEVFEEKFPVKSSFEL